MWANWWTTLRLVSSPKGGSGGPLRGVPGPSLFPGRVNRKEPGKLQDTPGELANFDGEVNLLPGSKSKVHIEIGSETFQLLERYAKPLVDTADQAIKRILHYLVREGIDLDDLSLSPQRSLPVSLSQGKCDKKYVDIDLGAFDSSAVRYRLIPLGADVRSAFPGYKVSFYMETDVGTVTSHVTSAPSGAPIGDPLAGRYICRGLGYWFEAHKDELKENPRVRIHILEPFARYRLEVVKGSQGADSAPTE